MEEKDLIKIKKIFKNYMNENNLTTLDFSIKMGVKVGTINTYISGKKFISKKFISTFLKLKKLKKNESDFLKTFIYSRSNYIYEEIEKKSKELEKIESLIKMKTLEFDTLERTSGVRSRIVWACIDIQKNVASKVIEIMSIYNMANSSNQKECLPALKQLSMHLDNFSIQIKKIIQERMEEIEYE